jgi:hypothetical protein
VVGYASLCSVELKWKKIMAKKKVAIERLYGKKLVMAKKKVAIERL